MISIQEEIEKLRYELSVTIPEEMHSAMEAGDLNENSEFHSILTRQHLINIRLKQLVNRLNNNKLIDITKISRDCVDIGSLVTVHNLVIDDVKKYKVVMNEISDEENEFYEEITYGSVLGKSFIGKKLHDEVTVYLPKKIIVFKIIGLQTIHELHPT